MNAPDRIWTHDDPFPEYIAPHESKGYPVQYIHSDLVNQLKGYTRHSVGCSAYPADSDKECDCGLTNLLSKIGEP